VVRPRDHRLAGFERLRQRIENLRIEFGKLVEEQHAEMGERRFAWPRLRAAADKSRHARRVMRRAERPVAPDASSGYLKHRWITMPSAPLIASRRSGRAFSTVTLSMLFKEIYELAGIRTSSHSGRRTFATRLNAKGVGMRTIQKLMGHKHISTTALYCDVSDEMLRNAVELV